MGLAGVVLLRPPRTSGDILGEPQGIDLVGRAAVEAEEVFTAVEPQGIRAAPPSVVACAPP